MAPLSDTNILSARAAPKAVLEAKAARPRASAACCTNSRRVIPLLVLPMLSMAPIMRHESTGLPQEGKCRPGLRRDACVRRAVRGHAQAGRTHRRRVVRQTRPAADDPGRANRGRLAL